MDTGTKHVAQQAVSSKSSARPARIRLIRPAVYARLYYLGRATSSWADMAEPPCVVPRRLPRYSITTVTYWGRMPYLEGNDRYHPERGT